MTSDIVEVGKILTAEEIEAVKNTTVFSQAQVNYTTLSPSIPNSACANCVFYRSTGYDGVDWPHCHLVQGYPLPIEPTGLCDEWRLNPEEEILEPAPVPVYIVDSPDGMDMEMEEMSLSVPKSFTERVKEFVSGLGKPKDQPFSVFKTAEGKMAWVARFTGKYIDREKEIIADKALEAYVDRVHKGLTNPPELWMWHAKGTKHGQAVTVWKAGGFLCAAGYFDDNEVGKSAFKYYQQNSGKIKLSHMFHYPKAAKINNVYHEINVVEITTLPDGAEAFPYTSFEEIQTMALPQIAKDMIGSALGADVLAAAETLNDKAVNDTAKMDSLGIASKGLDQYPGSELLDAVKKLGEFEAQNAEVLKRLEAAEAQAKAVEPLQATIKSLEDTVKTLSEAMEAYKTSETALLDRVNTMQKDVGLMTDLKSPASQSNETLLNDREKSLIDQVMNAAKSADTPSLVDSLIGGSPATISG